MNIETDTDRCVMCGLCLPHCPTYRITRQEGNSPRGRLALMRALNNGSLPRSRASDVHLDTCLQCGACESMCPSGVPYQSILDRTRQAAPPRTGRATRLVLATFADTRRRQFFSRMIRLLNTTALGSVTRPFIPGPLKRASEFLPLLKNGRRPAPRQSGQQQTVSVFTGCIHELADAESQQALVRLLTSAGLGVAIPDDQQCCGALHAHHGDASMSHVLLKKNQRAFSGDESGPILSLASGCTNFLTREMASTDLAERIIDACRFLATSTQFEQLEFNALNASALVHTPCTRQNGLRDTSSVDVLLSRIPKLSVTRLPAEGQCCGAAGTYFLEQPEISDRLLDLQLDAIESSRSELLVTDNVGCALQLRQGIELRGLAVEVVHPISLLARQLAH